MTKNNQPSNLIQFRPKNYRELFYKKVRDNRIGTIGTVELVGRSSNMTLLTIVYWVGNQREVFIYGRRIKWLRRYTR